MMMFTVAQRDKRIVENTSEVPNAPSLGVLHNRRPLFSGSPASGVSLQSSEFSPSSSFSNGFLSSEDDSSYVPPPPPEEFKDHQVPTSNRFSKALFLGPKSPRDPHANVTGKSVEELGLSHCLGRLNIRREEPNGGAKMVKGFEGFGFGGNSEQYNNHYNRYCSYNDIDNVGYDVRGFQSSSHGTTFSVDDGGVKGCTSHGLEGGLREQVVYDSLTGSYLVYDQPHNDVCSGFGRYREQRDCYLLEQWKEHEKGWNNRGIPLQNHMTSTGTYQNSLGSLQQYKLEASGGSNAMDRLISPQLTQPGLDLNCDNPLYTSLMLKQRVPAIANNRFPQSLVSVKNTGDLETFSCEDSFILQHNGLNCASTKRHDLVWGQNKNSPIEISAQDVRVQSNSMLQGMTCENSHTLNSYSPLPMLPTISSLAEIQGYIYTMAEDQNGCRILQRIFDEGTSRDVQIIFNEIINYVVELMLMPFGNYVIQKLLDVCSEDQRLQIVLMVIKEPGKLLGICLNTYGTRVIQKLIETVKTRQQISLLVLALKPGFLDLMKDQNGNHVIQRCLQCLNNEDNKFVFDAAAKFCVDIATHRHGCCVMQRCIAHATGKLKEKLISQVSRNSLLLAQDPFGNYVVQYVIELKNPSSIAYMISQFKGHYVHLSMQKFSSHVVEKCLRHFEESRSQIILELLSMPHFEQLMQDPYANYVIQSALAFAKGPLHSAMVEAVQPHMILRTSPYCKRIFSRNLLKK